MQRFSRLLTLLAVILFTGQPVMACCVEGHTETVTAEAEPPCHEPEGQKSAPATGDPCPGCEDCGVMAGALDSKPPKQASHDPGTELAAAPSSKVPAMGFDVRIRGATGPPAVDIRFATPVSLHQQLLI